MWELNAPFKWMDRSLTDDEWENDGHKGGGCVWWWLRNE